MKKLLVFGVIVLFLGMSVIPSTGTTVIENELPTELIIDGPTHGNVGELLEYILILNDPEGCEIWFYIDWDDGTNPDWIGPYMAGDEALVSHTWYECGIYNFSVQVEGCDGTMYSGTFEVTIIDNHPPSTPIISGEKGVIIGEEFDYYFRAIDPDGDDVRYIINWDDDNSVITDFYNSGEEVTVGHTYLEKGTYVICAFAEDIHGAVGPEGYYIPDWKNKALSTVLIVVTDNHPPDAPKITGPKTVRPGTHEWTFKAIDPDGDTVSYYIDWDDGDFEDWFGPFESGEEATRKHTVIYFGTVTIRARAKDIHGAIGDWGHFELEIPKSEQIISPLFYRLLERFPLLYRLVHILGW